MAKPSRQYVCQSCGTVSSRWSGKCESCGTWNSLVEEAVQAPTPGGLKGNAKGRHLNLTQLSADLKPVERIASGDPELDRVTGGGLVPGSAILIGGDPGIGKSTLLLQTLANLARTGRKVAYISGEESIAQVQLRAARMGHADAPVDLAASTSVRDAVATFDQADAPDVLVIDSIQTLYLDNLESAPGTVGQVRGASQELIRLAKRRGIVLLLVGHVTKEGTIAGPKVVEHMVDAVLHFEGDRDHQYRLLRALKNRFGPSDEIGVYEMVQAGLTPVANPSALFLTDRQEAVPGTAIFAGMEGTRPLLVEIQALVSTSSLATPRRAVVGWDSQRLAMILAVLDARCGLSIGGKDVYLSVVGGMRISEPAADLAVAAAILSSLSGAPIPDKQVLFGEIGLSGEVRSVANAPARLREAAKLGFQSAISGPVSGDLGDEASGLKHRQLDHMRDLLGLFAVPDEP